VTSDVKEYECDYFPLREAAPINHGRERGSVTFYLIPTRKGGSPHTERYSKAEREASLIADIIARIMGKKGKEVTEYHLYPSIREKIERGVLAIGVLFFAYTHIKTFETCFREEGLPFMVNRGRGFYRGEEVMEVVQLLQYLADKEQRISLLAALRGSIFGVTDADIFDCFIDKGSLPEGFLNSPMEHIRVIGNQLKKWRVLSSHLSIPELIRMILYDRGLIATLSAHPNRVQRVANMEKLIEIGRKFEAEGNGSLPDFVSYCLRMAEEEDDEGGALVEIPQGIPIHLMTIHAAKGLEFPMVIIPELDRALPREPKLGKPVRLYPADRSGKDIWNDHEGLLPLLRVEYPLVDFKKVFGPLCFMLKMRDTSEDVAENRRVFFVGCTRAIDHLILAGYMQVEKRRDSEEPFTSYDYREGAPIIDLMDDIWKIRDRYQEDAVGRYPKEKEYPLVVWESPTPQRFTGVDSSEMSIPAADFRRLDEKVRKVDFTAPLLVPFYHQLSPTSLALYKSCPMKFYYKYWLAIPEDPEFSVGEDIAEEPWGDTGEGETFVPRIIGIIVHAYLERHIFGSDLDRGLLDNLFSTFFGQKREVMLLERTILERIKARVTEMVLTTTADEALSRLLAGVAQYSELPFVFNNKRYTLRGRIDKLFKVTGGEGWAILDWKTGDPKDIDPARFAREHYFDLQLACYKVVVEKLKNTIVQAMYLYFTSLGRLVRIEYRGDPDEVISDLMEFTEEYKAYPDQVGKRIRRAMEREGICTACSYCNLGVC
jgi:ATP-dependent exoDNAse (exonuclease V) beta subunit